MVRAWRFCLTVVLTTLPALVAAQPTTGTIRGQVRDSSSAALRNATISIRDALANRVGQTTSDGRGEFAVPLLPPAAYVVTATASGFRDAEVIARVTIAGVTTVDLVLSPAGVAETVTVRATSSVVLSASAVTTQIEGELMRQMPSANRHALQFARLAPGVEGFAGAGQIIGQDGSNAVIANGQRSTQNSFYLDGAENAGAWRNWALQFPNPDTVQEVQVQSANASAQYGKQPGAVVNVVMRAGTNRFGGTVFHFRHDERLNANSWANNRNGLEKPEDNQRYSGAVLGGPIRRDSTFFFASYNHYRADTPVTQVAGRFPTAAMKRGDFSEVPDFVQPDGTVVAFNIKDPVTGASLGKSLPASMMNSASTQLLPLLPTAAAYYDQAVRQFERPRSVDEYLGKVEHRLTDRQRVAVTTLVTSGAAEDAAHSFNNNTVPAWGAARTTGTQVTAFGKYSWSRRTFHFESRAAIAGNTSDVRSTVDGQGPADFGIRFPFTPQFNLLPSILLDNEGGFRADHQQNDYIGQRNHRVGGTAIWTPGRHLVTLGAETQVDRVSFDGNRDLRLAARFTGRDALNGPITSASQVPLAANNFGTQNFAYAFADFLMGRAVTASTAGYSTSSFASRSSSVFAQDEWQVRHGLTISLGARYELTGDVSEENGRFGGSFVLGHQSSQYPNAPLGLAWAGDVGLESGVLPRDRNNVAPRVGLAWDMRGDGRTTLRAATGIYYATVPLGGNIFSGTSGFGGASPAAANLLLSDPYGTSKINPYDTAYQYGPSNPVPDPVQGYTPATFPWEGSFRTQIVRGVLTRSYVGAVVGHDPALTTPSVVESHVTLERALRPGVSVAAGYVGNRGYHQPMWLAFNAPVPTVGGDTSTQSVLDRRPLAEYGGGRVFSTILDTQYDALQISSDLHFGGLSAMTSYVLARNVSPFGVGAQDINKGGADGLNTGAQSAEAILDSSGNAGQGSYPYDVNRDRAENGRRHAFKISYAYELPWPDDRKWLGGWVVSGYVVAASGIPLNVVWGMDANADSSTADRPSALGTISYRNELVANTSADRRGAIQYLSAADFVGPCGTNARTGTAAFCPSSGTLGRNAVHGVPVYDIDLAVVKSIKLGNPHRVELRVEAYNLPNVNFLGSPTLDMSSPFFGQVLSRIHRPRLLQLGIKAYF